jgi:regulator of protease activity HflC (stomatin/prohibitin superfamily)
MDLQETIAFTIWAGLFGVVIFQLIKSLRIVPQRFAMIVERLGRYHMTLHSGFHILIPFFDKVTYVIDLKEESIDVPPQECFTKDEVKVNVDGVIYISVVDPVKAAYGVTNYKWASMQLAQTTTRSIIGKLSLDQTFEERAQISKAVVNVLDETATEWGIQVHRYEIKNIEPPKSVQASMEKQVRAEREKRAIISRAEGDAQSRVNKSEGIKAELINVSEGEKQKKINEALGQASQILSIGEATAASIEKLAASINIPGGEEALNLKIDGAYLKAFGKLGRADTKVLVPMNVAKSSEVLKDIKSGF